MRLTGKCKFFLADKGYGFITRQDGGADLFVHISALKKAGLESLERDAPVTFEVQESPKGQRAVAVELVR